MATSEEIRQRVEHADTARSARRAAAAQQIGELARRRATIAEQLEDVEHRLGDVLAAAQDVIGIDELAEFTDLKTADLTHWLAGRKPARIKRKRPNAAASGTDTRGDASRGPSAPGTSTTGHVSTLPESAVIAVGASAPSERAAVQAP